MKYAGTREGRIIFDFACPPCGARGEVGVFSAFYNKTGTWYGLSLTCPEGCGARFLPFLSFDGVPDLLPLTPAGRDGPVTPRLAFPPARFAEKQMVGVHQERRTQPHEEGGERQ